LNKKYKVGDTIYAKGKVKEIDSGDDYLPYKVKFEDNSIDSWLSKDSILEPPVKPVIPKGVADEIEEYKLKGVDLINYFSSISISGCDTKNSYNYVYMNTHEVTESHIGTLADAWNNGYTVASELNYLAYLPLPVSDLKNHNCAQLYHFDDQPILQVKWSPSKTTELQYKDERYQFTKEEIDQLRVDYQAVEIKESHTDEG